MASEKALYLVVPKIGEGIIEVAIVRWLKSPGDNFNKDEPLVEIATDKVDSEISAPFSGVLKDIIVQEGHNAKVGSSIALIDDLENVGTTDYRESIPKTSNYTDKDLSNGLTTKPFVSKNHLGSLAKEKIINKYCSPIALKVAKDANLSIEEIKSLIKRINGIGKTKVEKKDILEYLQRGYNNNKTDFKNGVEIQLDISKDDKVVELDRIRSITAQKMTLANNTIPHVTSFVDVDITDVLKWRLEVKDPFFKKYGIPLTLTPLFIWAIAKTLKKYPTINSHFNSKNLLINKKEINIGMAVALKDNNLIVPVIRNAETLSLPELATIIGDLATRAREKKLKPVEVAGATFSVSNIGVFNTSMGTPIITPPQVAVLAIGSVSNKLAFADDKKTISERSIITLCHTYDHRVIDGALGGIFANEVGKTLQQVIEIDLLHF